MSPTRTSPKITPKRRKGNAFVKEGEDIRRERYVGVTTDNVFGGMVMLCGGIDIRPAKQRGELTKFPPNTFPPSVLNNTLVYLSRLLIRMDALSLLWYENKILTVNQVLQCVGLRTLNSVRDYCLL